MRRYHIIIALSFGMVLFSSCDKWLTLEPYDGVNEDDYWQTKEEVHSMVIGCYSSLCHWDIIINMILWGEMRGDMMRPGMGATNEYVNIYLGEINPSQSPCNWNQFYSTINQCNKVIERAPGVRDRDNTFTERLMHQYVAEATAIRSMMYFYLVRAFRDVPFVLNATDSDDQEFYVPKTEGRFILDSLVTHLRKAREFLPPTYGRNDHNKGRMTYYTATALLADIYLWQENYVECINMCNQIINSGQYSLIPVQRTAMTITKSDGEPDDVFYPNIADADDLFEKLYVTQNSVESIFEIQFPTAHPSLGDPFFRLFGSAVGRPRLMANTPVLNEFIFPVYRGGDRNVFDIRGNNFSFSGGTAAVWKFTGKSRSASVTRIEREYANMIVYRLAEIMLMKAEALNQIAIHDNNDQVRMKESYDLVMQIRARSNALESTETILLEPINGKALERLILFERARELAFEGKRWFDVLRFSKRDNYANRQYLMELAVNSTSPEKVYSLQTKYENDWFHYWPIHNSAIDTNPNLKQNPVWETR